MIEKSHRQVHLERLTKLRQMRRKILSLPAADALNTLIEAPQPAPLVHSFPEEDLFLLMHDIGPDDFLPVLSMASDRQWEYLLDMEVWHKDRIDMGAMTEWIGRLLKADPGRLWKLMLKEEKIEFIEFYLFKNLEVRIREHDEDPSDFGDNFFTYDDVFYFRIMDAPFLDETAKENREEVIAGLVSHLAAMDLSTFHKVLLESQGIIPAETEENLYSFRNLRLAEKGFLPFEEALGIYTPFSREEFQKLRPKDLHTGVRNATMAMVPLFYDGSDGEQNLFSRALAGIADESILLQLQSEFAALCNRIIAADTTVIREKSTLAGIVKKAGGYISLGLEVLSTGKKESREERNIALISGYPLSAIFRVGYGKALELKSRAGKWVEQSWFKSNKLPLSFWGEELTGVIGGLLIKKPLFFDNYETGVLYREFETGKDLTVTSGLLSEAQGFDAVFSLMDLTLTPPSEGFLTHKSLILTLFARDSLGLSGDFGPVPMELFKSFFTGLWSPENKGKIHLAAKSAFLTWLAGATGLTPLAISERIGNGLEKLFNEVEGEYAAVSPDDLDPRYLTLFHTVEDESP